MAVQFILGSAGSGKSHRLYTIMTDRSLNNPQTEYVALVPEQYSLESQKEIVSIHKNRGAFNTEVVSFNRLALRTFEELGMDDMTVIDEMGKLLIIRKVLEEHKNELKIYANKITMPGFVDKIKSTISEFEQYGIGVKELEDMMNASEKKQSLKTKLGDVTIVYDGFKKYMNEKLATSEEVLDLLCTAIPRSKRIVDSEFFIDGYTGFTPIQKKVVFLLIRYAKNVTFAFNLPEDEIGFSNVSEQDLFLLSKKTIKQIKDECAFAGVEVLQDIVIPNVEITTVENSKVVVKEDDNSSLKGPYRLRNSAELSFIEQNIFRYKNVQGLNIITDNNSFTTDISVHSVSNPRKECEFVAKSIVRMMEENDDYKFRDFAVISGDLENYYHYMEEAFADYNISGFIDYKRDVSSNPYIMAVLAALEIIDKDFTYDSVFHFLSLGVMNTYIGKKCEKYREDKQDALISNHETRDAQENYENQSVQDEKNAQEDYDIQDIFDRMDNYVLMSGRRGINSYSKQWEKVYKGISEEQLKIVNVIRESIVELISPLKASLKKKNTTVFERTVAVYNFIKELNMFGMIQNDAKRFEEMGEMSRSLEYGRVYDAIMDMLDKMVAMLGGEVISFKEYKGLLETGFGNLKVGIVPPSYDSVMVGDIERTRLKDIKKVIFVIGANDGIIPKSGGGVGIISDHEREFLAENRFELAPTARENVFSQRLYLYMALSKPSDKLIISYSKSDIKGDEIRSSYIINTLKELLPNLYFRDEDRYEYNANNIVNGKDALKYIAHYLNKSTVEAENDEFYQIYSLMITNEEYRKKLFEMVDAAFYHRSDDELDEVIANKLYGIRDNVGITRIERFAACAYAHFIENGLKLNQRRQYELAAYDLGNLYHGAIDRVFSACRDENISICDISEEKKRKLIEKSVSDVFEEFDTDILTSTARYKYLAQRVKTVTESTIDVLTKHLKKGEYNPRYNEYSIRHGRVDRVDVYDNNTDMYVKVIDYKTGNKKIDFTDVYYGLQLQLLVYTDDVIKQEQNRNPGKTVHPGGAFYYCIQDPLIEKPDFKNGIKKLRDLEEFRSMTDAELRKYIADSEKEELYKLSGILNSDEESLRAIDREAFDNKTKSKVAPVDFKKDGSLSSTSVVFEEQDFKKILDYAGKLTEYMKDEIFAGCISVNPFEDSCRYCEYRGICRFDTFLGDKFRIKEKVKQNEFIEKIEETDNNSSESEKGE
jgi:ATP-dependent helicase/nuclease subunit B